MTFNIAEAIDLDQPEPFHCPYCGQHSTLRDGNNYSTRQNVLRLDGSKHGPIGISIAAATCLNPDCGEINLGISLEKVDYRDGGWRFEGLINQWTILPESSARPQPDFIPDQIRKSYTEACRIKELSPTASATLSRRCLQAMIHDFWGIDKGNLYKEIEALPDEVSQQTIEAIHAVREIGNIGAHMKLDTNTLVDVDANEAAAMIDLIELLFDGWYVDRHNKSERLRKMTETIAKRSGRKDGTDVETTTEVTESHD